MLGSADARRSAIYRQLASLEEAGIPIRNAVDRVVSPDLAAVGRALDEGLSTGEAWARAGRFTPLEVVVVSAGAKSGQLAEGFASLAKIYEEAASAKRALVAGLAYPFILIHVAFLVPKLYLLIQKGPLAYAQGCVLPLACLYAGVAALVFLGRGFARSSPAAASLLLRSIPLLGGMLTRRALVHGLRTLTVVYRAGVAVTDAVDGAAQAAGFFPVREGFRRVRERLDSGSSIGDAFLAETTFPVEVREAASVGATTGKLEEQLDHVCKRLESEASTQKALLITIVPVLTYLIVAAVIGYMVISFWTGLYSGLDLPGF